ncbi:hemin uptake protein HemP [Humitalea sp. 24SJ18S-53]|uniref:hemin uptake protein HemP n=1 Tax=Humitalea sp. 24SJ18S-53 TaxID=3422307 RepID=UPI003D66D3AA
MTQAAGMPTATSTATTPSDAPHPPLPVLEASTLFAESREVLIRHREESYRLRLTSSNKLILTK